MNSMYIYLIILYMFLLDSTIDLIMSEKMTPLAIWLRSAEGTLPPKEINNSYINNPLLILIWKFGLALERRHIWWTHKKHNISLWDGCSVNNCKLTYDLEDKQRADAVIFHLHWMTRRDAREIASWSQHRRSKQLWIFLTDESPINTKIWPEYNGLFNWSMTYRSDSDIPVAYGRTIRRRIKVGDIIDNFENMMRTKTKFIAIMGSNCVNSQWSGSNRWQYVQELSNHLPGQIDIYGRCLHGNTTSCPGHFWSNCPSLKNYKFYLAFENTNCREYLTEKVFWNAYSKFAVPVIMGPPRIDCERLLPPHSYIHVDDFRSIYDLADHLLMLDLSDDAYYDYHTWRNNYIVLNEHGYFGTASRHYCRICEGLHYNPMQPPQTYWDLQRYWSRYDQCSKNLPKLI